MDFYRLGQQKAADGCKGKGKNCYSQKPNIPPSFFLTTQYTHMETLEELRDSQQRPDDATGHPSGNLTSRVLLSSQTFSRYLSQLNLSWSQKTFRTNSISIYQTTPFSASKGSNKMFFSRKGKTVKVTSLHSRTLFLNTYI